MPQPYGPFAGRSARSLIIPVPERRIACSAKQIPCSVRQGIAYKALKLLRELMLENAKMPEISFIP